MKKSFLQFYNFLRDTSFVLVLMLLVSLLFLAKHSAMEKRLMGAMGYEAIGSEETILSIQSSSSVGLEKEKPFAIQVQNGTGYIQLSDIHFVTMQERKPVVVLENNDSLRCRLNLSKLYEQFDDLNPMAFFLANSEIFPISQIRSITSKPVQYNNSNGTQYFVKLKGGVSFPLSERRAKDLKNQLNNF